MRKEVIVGCAIMVATACLCICVAVLSVMTGGCDVHIIGALVIGGIVVGGVIGSQVLQRLPERVSVIGLPVSFVVIVACLLLYEILNPTAIVVSCLVSGISAGSCGGALGYYRGMEV